MRSVLTGGMITVSRLALSALLVFALAVSAAAHKPEKPPKEPPPQPRYETIAPEGGGVTWRIVDATGLPWRPYVYGTERDCLAALRLLQPTAGRPLRCLLVVDR